MARWHARALFVMVLSFLVAMVGTIAVIDAQQPLAKTDGLWLMAFALLAVATAVAAVLSRQGKALHPPGHSPGPTGGARRRWRLTPRPR